MLPTSLPTLTPTTGDTFTFQVEIEITSTSLPTASKKSSLKSLIASQLNIAESKIKHFTVTYVEFSSRRRSLFSTTYVWTTTFDVQVALSTTTESTINGYTSFVEKKSVHPILLKMLS
jgi:hypothetical protein